MSPEVMSPETRVMSPEIYSNVTRYLESCRLKLHNAKKDSKNASQKERMFYESNESMSQ